MNFNNNKIKILTILLYTAIQIGKKVCVEYAIVVKKN